MKKILLVEDDFYIRGLYKMAFEKKGDQVIEAKDGEEALSIINKEKFDFIVLDLMLPGVSGLEVLKQIKASRQIPVYILTNVGDEVVLKRALAAGADAYFIKVNYTPRNLVEAIEEKEAS